MDEVDLTTLAALGGLILTLWKSYDSNRKQTEQMHNANMQMFSQINSKLDVMWNWFINNQIKKQ